MTQVAIIGGGIAGLSAAACLADDAAVTVFEAEDQLAYHASGRSAAMFLEDYGNNVVCALNKASKPGLFAIENLLKPRTMYLLGQSHQAEKFAVQAQGFGLERISFDEAHARVPILDPGTCALVAARDDVFDLDTDLIFQHFRKKALASGARIKTGVRIDQIAWSGDGWRLSAGARNWQADVLVNAAGAWADQVAEMAGIRPIGLQPYRRSMARLAAPGGHDTRNWPFMDGVDDLWYAKPDAGGLIVSPGEEDPMDPHDAWADDMVLAEGLARYETMVTEEVTRPVATWAGLRSFAPDRALVIGPDPANRSFLWCAGQGGYGFQTCIAASQLLSDRAFGRQSELSEATVAALSPDRFA